MFYSTILTHIYRKFFVCLNLHFILKKEEEIINDFNLVFFLTTFYGAKS